MTASNIPGAVQKFIETTNAEDSAGFLSLFTPNASLDDWGRVYSGVQQISLWNQTDNIGRHSRFELLSAQPSADTSEWSVELRVTGGGFNGDSPFRFQLAGDAIQALIISPT